jgi:hypothetical protein|tara:strand:+ start:486 stop:647 length:162 start_codon:yes stop_codon:yes gene_type:complete
MSIQRIEVDGFATMQITGCLDKQLIGVMAVKLIKLEVNQNQTTKTITGGVKHD